MALKTRTQLIAEAEEIRDEEDAGANTATRVGTCLLDMIDSMPLSTEVDLQATAVAFTNIASLSGTGETQDGIALNSAGVHICHCVAQTDASENGPWVVQTGPWTRPETFTTGQNAGGVLVGVQQGTIYAESIWKCTSDDPNAVIDTDNLTWEQVGPWVRHDAATGYLHVGHKTYVNSLRFASAGGAHFVNTNDAFEVFLTDNKLQFKPQAAVVIDCAAAAVGVGQGIKVRTQVGASTQDSGDLELCTGTPAGVGAKAGSVILAPSDGSNPPTTGGGHVWCKIPQYGEFIIDINTVEILRGKTTGIEFSNEIGDTTIGKATHGSSHGDALKIIGQGGASGAYNGGYVEVQGGADGGSGTDGGVKLNDGAGTTKIVINATGCGFNGANPVAPAADMGALTDNTAGAATNNTVQALTDPGDAPATADALRDDLVANLIPELRNNFKEILEHVNALHSMVSATAGGDGLMV